MDKERLDLQMSICVLLGCEIKGQAEQQWIVLQSESISFLFTSAPSFSILVAHGVRRAVKARFRSGKAFSIALIERKTL